MFGSGTKIALPSASEALPSRAEPVSVAPVNVVTGQSLQGPYPPHLEQCLFGLGSFWGAERLFWRQSGVFTTAVGYAGGFTPNPTYEELCSGGTGHSEVVLVVYDPAIVTFDHLLACFWDSHDPTQGMRQGADRGTQFRSCIYTMNLSQTVRAEESRSAWQRSLTMRGPGVITTEIRESQDFYFAEDHHQQYLHKHPNGYCGVLGGSAAEAQSGACA